MPSPDPAIRDHKAWLGYVQQEGLVVSPAALVDAQVVLDRNTLPMQERFLPFVKEVAPDGKDPVPAVTDFPAFARGFLQWPDDCLHGLDPTRPLPDSLTVALQEGESISPSFALRDPRPASQPLAAHRSPLATPDWLLLAQSLPLATDLDARTATDERAWSASPTQRMERLLRETRVPIGLLTNGTHIRLIYAPHGENSGNITFTVRYMAEVAGRPILAALHMLLGECCSAAAPSTARLPALLARSREYQSTVSTQLAGQVLDALYELLRGFQAADERAKGELLRAVLAKNPDDIYSGLLTVLMRMVFLLFAEDRGIVPTDPKTKRATGLYVRNYSVHGLFERLRADAERYPDTMDQRYGAWAQLLALFRAVHDGCKHPQMQMPPRRGNLFDPDRFKFLEGRTVNSEQRTVNGEPSDPTVHRSPLTVHTTYENRILPRPQGVAGRTSACQTGLSADTQSAIRGEVRSDLADAPGSGINSIEHRGGLGTTLPSGVHPVSSDSERQPGRIGNPVDPHGGPPASPELGCGPDSGGQPESGSPNSGFGAKHKETNGEQRAEVKGEQRTVNGNKTPESGHPSPFTVHRSLPLVSDGTLFRVLHNLLILDGERLSYRTLDVEEIGSVYQTVMGFRLEIAAGPSIAIKGQAKKGSVPAATTINLDELLAAPAKDRPKWLAERTDQELPDAAERALKAAASIDDLLAALERKVARNATPSPVAKGGLVLQPTDERRRSGSHYTPRSFTQPIVRKTLAPILRRLACEAAASSPSPLNGERAGVRGETASERPNHPHLTPTLSPPSEGAERESRTPPLVQSKRTGLGDTRGTILPLLGGEGRGEGETRVQSTTPVAAPVAVPTPDQILSLKICDLAVGSAAFLVEACRQLAEELLKAWRHHGGRPSIPPDETEELFAMRLIAQRCLYGVDRNPMAVDLAKLSLWLATLAKDHPFTFLDHAIRPGDSLVGLTRRQIEGFTWQPEIQTLLFAKDVAQRTAAALRERQNLLGMGDDYGTPQLKREKLEKADELLDLVRFIGDAAIAAYFSADKDKAREQKRVELAERIAAFLSKGDLSQRPTAEVAALRSGQFPVTPFHWEIEFPEVFERENPGFDAFVGNPPFVGGTMISTANGLSYKDWLYCVFPESGNRMDLVAYFFRQAFSLLRRDGALGLIATKTIAQGDTRQGGLRFICNHGGTIYDARRRVKWPGQAAVVVSMVHVLRGEVAGIKHLDETEVPCLTAFLFPQGGNDDPDKLKANEGRSYEGVKPYGQGFVFDDNDPKANPIAEMERLVAQNPSNRQIILPYIAGEEINDSPTQQFTRFIISFGRRSLDDCRAWPDLLRIVESRVKPEREGKSREVSERPWWQFFRVRGELAEAIRGLSRVLVVSRVSQHFGFAFIPSGVVPSEAIVVFPFASFSPFALLQSRLHEAWARFFASSLEDRLRYTPSDCFETFPFPAGWETNAALEAAGREYYEFRAALMVRNNEGLTKTYNRFHDPQERSPDIQTLRDLHARMDAAVLAAYGWTDLPTACDFILDYEEDDDATGGPGDVATGASSHSPQVSKSQSRRRKPWRYRWPDEIRDEVLARLLKLNAERAQEEKLSGLVAAAAGAVRPKQSMGGNAKRRAGTSPAQGDLISRSQGDLFQQSQPII